MERASSSGVMAANMKVAGTRANSMAKVSISTNMALNALARGSTERDRAGMTIRSDLVRSSRNAAICYLLS